MSKTGYSVGIRILDPKLCDHFKIQYCPASVKYMTQRVSRLKLMSSLSAQYPQKLCIHYIYIYYTDNEMYGHTKDNKKINHFLY